MEGDKVASEKDAGVTWERSELLLEIEDVTGEGRVVTEEGKEVEVEGMEGDNVESEEGAGVAWESGTVVDESTDVTGGGKVVLLESDSLLSEKNREMLLVMQCVDCNRRSHRPFLSALNISHTHHSMNWKA